MEVERAVPSGTFVIPASKGLAGIVTSCALTLKLSMGCPSAARTQLTVALCFPGTADTAVGRLGAEILDTALNASNHSPCPVERPFDGSSPTQSMRDVGSHVRPDRNWKPEATLGLNAGT